MRKKKEDTTEYVKQWNKELKRELKQSVNAYVELCEKHKKLKAEFNELKKENKQLENNIDKVITLLEESAKYRKPVIIEKQILNILKGDSE